MAKGRQGAAKGGQVYMQQLLLSMFVERAAVSSNSVSTFDLKIPTTCLLRTSLASDDDYLVSDVTSRQLWHKIGNGRRVEIFLGQPDSEKQALRRVARKKSWNLLL